MTTSQQVYDLLQRMSREGLAAAKRLFWTELNYDQANVPLSTREWPAGVQALLHTPPLLLAHQATAQGAFDIVYTPLVAEQPGRGFPLSVTAERQLVAQLLPNHPYALFVFSDPAERHWHLVNVKYRGRQGAPTQQVFRRIAIGPHERLRTAAERIALLDLAPLGPRLSPLAIQQRHDEAFDVEAVTRAFFTAYRERFEAAEALITGIPDPEERRLFTQRLFNRLLFIVFLERKGWLTFQGRSDYLQALWEAHLAERAAEPQADFYRDRLTLLFFSGLNNPGSVNITGIHTQGFIQERIGNVPYLNGGLFEREVLDEREGIGAPDAIFAPLFEELLYHYNFTVTESTPLDVEVAVDPEMLGKIFEELVTGRHETGSYYTPKPIVAFMCREALKGYLQSACPHETPAALADFVEQRDAGALRQPEAVLAALRRVKACDPACGSGAYLLGLLHELVELRQALFVSRRVDALTTYARKLEIIQQNLYGVDVDPFAVNIARLRLWLSLIVDFEGETPPPLPNLEFKIEAGDSLTAPAPAPLQPDLFRQQDVARFFELKGAFMQAHGPEKKALRAEIEALKATIAAWAGEESGAGAFDWAVDFAEVFTPLNFSYESEGGDASIPHRSSPLSQLHAPGQAGGGFDLVVANPPYVRQELLGSALKARLKKRYPAVYTGTADLYVYFYARALELLRPGGVAAFITSNKWLRAGYGEKLRQHLHTAAAVQTLIDFGDLPVFGAIAYPQIIVFRNAPPPAEHTVRALTVTDLGAVEQLSEVVQAEAWAQPRESLRADGWTLVKPITRDLMKKIRLSGLPLKDYVGGQIFVGLKTGLNQAFIIDRQIRDQLASEDPESLAVIHSWLRGRDVKRWQIKADQQYIIAIPSSNDKDAQMPWSKANSVDEAFEIFRDAYPSIWKYLQQYEGNLRKRSDQGKFWWELRSCAYYWAFSQPKIIWPDIAKRCEFTLDHTNAYVDMTLFVIPTDDLFLLGILNSSVVEWSVTHTSSTIQQGFLRFKNIYVSPIPIPTPTAEQRAAIETLVTQLLALHREGRPPATQVAALEAELNAQVYAVYDLTRAEIAVVEAATGQQP